MLSSLLVCGLLFILACGPAENNPASVVKDEASKVLEAAGDFTGKTVIVAKDTISVDTAFAWAKRWESIITGANMPLIQGYTLPIIDLKQVIDAGADSARFYLGQEASGEYKLMLVGVNDLGQDMVNTNPKTPLDRVYDLSTPCPPDCGSLIK